MASSWVLVIVAGLVFTALGRGVLSRQITAYLPGIQTVVPQLGLILVGGVALTALGMVDDRIGLSPGMKLAGQFCVAGAVACWGVRITLFWDFPAVTWAVTTFWILLVINAMNFFDNMDGLAAGTAAIAAAFFLFIAGLRGQHFVAVLAAVTCGSAAGFLVHNRPPARIFMGDAGSHFLGYSLAVTGALTTYYTPTESLTPAPVLIPLIILGVPLFDAVAVVVLRWRRGTPIYVGDNTHLSHRLTDLGCTRPQAVALIWLLAFIIGSGAVTMLWLPFAGTVVVLLQTGALLALMSLLEFFVKGGRET